MDSKIHPQPTRSNSGSLEGGRYTETGDNEVKDIRNIPTEGSGPAWELAQMSPEEYRAFEKKTLWKMDVRIIPWITLLYLISFLDRVNIGVARLTGLLVDLNLTSKQFSNASMIFFVSYVAFEVPSNLVLKKFKPSRWIPFTMICWALFQTFMGLVKNYESLLALRFCLGIFEAGLFPGLNFFLTGWYRREEINKRVAVFFGGAVLAGAFGGIFGYALSRMAGVGGLNGWQWIFIMEGILTMIIGIASFWMMQDWPDQAKFLSPLEREFVLSRLKKEQGPAGETTFGKRHLKQAFSDWKMWCLMIMYIGAGEPLYSLALFSPTIVASLGTFSIPQSLLMSTPPYVIGFITTLGTAYLSDKYRRRAPFLMFWSAIATLGYVLLMALPSGKVPGVHYFALFIATAGAAPMIATTISWTGNTWSNGKLSLKSLASSPTTVIGKVLTILSKKAITMGMVFSSGNSGGIVASQVYRSENAPKYYPGHGTAVGFCLANFTMAALLWWYLARENKRRDLAYGRAVDHGDDNDDIESPEYREKWGLEGKTRTEIIELGENHPGYRYVL